MTKYQHSSSPADGRLLSGIDAFLAVVRCGSFMAAAEPLAMTQSGVSRAIARLEERLGVRLFDRTSRTIALTDEGRTFHERVAPLLAGIEEAASDAAGAGGRVSGRLRVQVAPLAAHLVLAPHIDRFMSMHPLLAVEIVEDAEMGDLVGGGFDAAILFGEPAPSALVHRRLLETRVLTCAARSYIERRGRPKHPRDLGGGEHECILFRDPATRRPFEWVFQRGREIVPVDAKGRLVVSHPSTAIAACIAGYGVAQMLEIGARKLVREGAVEQLLPEWAEERFPLYVYYPSRHLPPARVRAFVDWVVSLAQIAGRRA
ncbi:LysR family transcriptional regulator [Pendulispora albinea]|uniref:LysR family transcriptional regulator n=1 Tax=Pendulispora albinea TaxID=2741071 RepID=A0ABZ2M6S9_9BACT